MSILKEPLLTRAEFRSAVFERDGHMCVHCKISASEKKLDAHHIMERRLFPDGGYYVSNGVTLCDPDCHMLAEHTLLTCEQLRELASITAVILPPHLYSDEIYDKWGNPYLANGERVRGELFYDESVQRVLTPVLNKFTKYIKYPRTYHFSWSPGVNKDDRIQERPFTAHTHVVVTEKMDGENTTLYADYLHARSITPTPHPSRARVKVIWANVSYNIPDGWRVCGENLYAKHSIEYTDLEGFFQMFSIWNERNVCLSWKETEEWAALLDLPLVPVLYTGVYNESVIRQLAETVVVRGGEGIVVRDVNAFPFNEFRYRVAKYVRQNHVQTHGHWMRNVMVPNKLRNNV